MKRFARLPQIKPIAIPRARRFGSLAVLVVTLLATWLAPAAVAPSASASPSCPWLNESLPVGQRLQMLMSQMTLADKINMVTGAGFSEPYVFYISGIPSLCIPAMGAGGRPARRWRRSHRRDPDAGCRVAGGHLRSVARAAVRTGGRVRGARQGSDGQPRADREHRPRPALGQVIRGVHRGSVPQRQDGGVRDRRSAEPGRDVAGQAPRRLQPGDQPQHARRRRDRQHAGAARDLPAGVLGRDPAGEGGLGDVRLQHDQRRVRVPEPVPDADHARPAVGVPGLYDLGLPGDPLDRAVGRRRHGPGDAGAAVLRLGAAVRSPGRPGQHGHARPDGAPDPARDVPLQRVQQPTDRHRPARPSRTRPIRLSRRPSPRPARCCSRTIATRCRCARRATARSP